MNNNNNNGHFNGAWSLARSRAQCAVQKVAEKCINTYNGQNEVNKPHEKDYKYIVFMSKDYKYIVFIIFAMGSCLETRRSTHSAHRFPAPSSKLYQNWLRHWWGISPRSRSPKLSAPSESVGISHPEPQSKHRFPAPSSKFCQNWLRHWRGTLYLRAAVHRRGQHPPKDCGCSIVSCIVSKHARNHTYRPKLQVLVYDILPSREKDAESDARSVVSARVEKEKRKKEKKKKFPLDSDDFGFICAGVSNVVSCKRNVGGQKKKKKRLL